LSTCQEGRRKIWRKLSYGVAFWRTGPHPPGPLLPILGEGGDSGPQPAVPPCPSPNSGRGPHPNPNRSHLRCSPNSLFPREFLPILGEGFYISQGAVDAARAGRPARLRLSPARRARTFSAVHCSPYPAI